LGLPTVVRVLENKHYFILQCNWQDKFEVLGKSLYEWQFVQHKYHTDYTGPAVWCDCTVRRTEPLACCVRSAVLQAMDTFKPEVDLNIKIQFLSELSRDCYWCSNKSSMGFEGVCIDLLEAVE
jgi:hypothetical protein